jgi:uncharacterized protein (TIGR00369 family)
MAGALGYDVTEVESGRIVIVAEPSAHHLNPAGTVHGGLAATMLDSCMGLAIQSTLDKGVGSTTLEFKISFVRPITPETGPIRAEARCSTGDVGSALRMGASPTTRAACSSMERPPA